VVMPYLANNAVKDMTHRSLAMIQPGSNKRVNNVFLDLRKGSILAAVMRVCNPINRVTKSPWIDKIYTCYSRLVTSLGSLQRTA
jgi:hypothetical protein